MEIRISGIIEESIVDGPGIRYTVFTQGCVHNCKGCHNPKTHDINGGTLRDCDDILNEIKDNGLLDGITLSGGEPFLQPQACLYLSAEVHKLGLNTVTYTGFTFEELLSLSDGNKNIMSLLESTDILIDGKFVLDKKDILLRFKGSENQRIIDVKRTLSEYEKTGEVVLYDFEDNI